MDEMTLEHFFFSRDDLNTCGKRDELEKTGSMIRIREAVAGVARGMHWEEVADMLCRSVKPLLDLPVREILCSGWTKQAEIEEYIRKSARQGGETFLVPLARHTLRSEHKPAVEILLNQRSLGEIVFHVSLAFTIDGAVLVIGQGHLREAKVRNCIGSGRICCDQVVMVEKAMDKIRFPDRFVFTC